MKASNTLEMKKLFKVNATIRELSKGVKPEIITEFRLQLLEATASRLSGFDLKAFQKRFDVKAVVPTKKLMKDARAVVLSIDECGIHPALVISALARETLDDSERRTSGAYHTDFRLAVHLAQSVAGHINPNMKVIDPACGAGILLVALSVVACGSDRILASEWIRNSVYAADLSSLALRGTLIALSTFTNDLDALVEMRDKWRVQDSLFVPDEEWAELAPGGFDLVIANPPWEKVKLSRHEYSKAKGEKRLYGEKYNKELLVGYEAAKSEKAKMASQLAKRYTSLATGDPDLYVAFTELSLKLTRPGGCGSIIVPAGLIRSLNTKSLRLQLVATSEKLAFTVMDNKARHFAIDTRFKFLFVNYVKAESSKHSCKQISISHGNANDDEVVITKAVKFPVAILRKLRPDLTLPEVRSAKEWQLYKKMQQKAVSSDCPNSPWHPSFCREVDMTHGKRYFRKTQTPKHLPLVEGRMVQPHRLGSKRYVSGEGRSAVWDNLPPGQSSIAPQFWMPISGLSVRAQERVKRVRAGFCDITGQTNERSMMASLIPPSIVCGNKVPTVEFPNDPSLERTLLWLSIVNSLPFDWMLRRVVTTTVNYFVLLSIQLPSIEIDSLPARRLIEIAKRLSKLDRCNNSSFDNYWDIALLKAEADVLVAKTYGCTESDLRLMFEDFPLIDRGQPSILGEDRSTVTRDLLLNEWSRRKNKKGDVLSARISEARKKGAIAYLSSEFVSCSKNTMELVYEN